MCLPLRMVIVANFVVVRPSMERGSIKQHRFPLLCFQSEREQSTELEEHSEKGSLRVKFFLITSLISGNSSLIYPFDLRIDRQEMARSMELCVFTDIYSSVYS